jgi:hypothetical protein
MRGAWVVIGTPQKKIKKTWIWYYELTVLQPKPYHYGWHHAIKFRERLRAEEEVP